MRHLNFCLYFKKLYIIYLHFLIFLTNKKLNATALLEYLHKTLLLLPSAFKKYYHSVVKICTNLLKIYSWKTLKLLNVKTIKF